MINILQGGRDYVFEIMEQEMRSVWEM